MEHYWLEAEEFSPEEGAIVLCLVEIPDVGLSYELLEWTGTAYADDEGEVEGVRYWYPVASLGYPI